MPKQLHTSRAGRRRVLMLVLAAVSALGLSGCPALMIPGLGYSAYKYEENHKQTKPATSTSTSTPSPDQIE